ncbi:MAG: glycosyltransferase family 2 protein [Christensenellales bacterium]|jgi:glycosyltransferase involved in cell wall biosynthesis
MNTQKPLVSVVMCNYNTKEEYLRSAIESILRQTYEHFEFIIIDDASTGNDVEVIRSYCDLRIILLQNERNRRTAYSANRGLETARGEYIARMDADDIALPYRLERQVAYMEQHRDIDILCAQTRFFDSREGVFAPNLTQPDRMKTALFFGCPIVNPTVMFRASFIRKHGIRYDESAMAEDYELWSRCIPIAKICEYPHVLLNYRVHAAQISTASHSLQTESANRVRERMLSWLGIAPSQREVLVHYHFCTDSPSPDVSLRETEEWARRLLYANDEHNVFPRRLFTREVIQHFFVAAVKQLLQKRIPLNEVLGMELMRKALSPRYYSGYMQRFLFSRRLNGLSNYL